MSSNITKMITDYLIQLNSRHNEEISDFQQRKRQKQREYLHLSSSSISSTHNLTQVYDGKRLMKADNSLDEDVEPETNVQFVRDIEITILKVRDDVR